MCYDGEGSIPNPMHMYVLICDAGEDGTAHYPGLVGEQHLG